MVNKFSERLEDLRKKRGLTQEALADALEVSRGAISYYEKGQRVADVDFLCRAAHYFNVSADYLLGFTDHPTTDKDIQYIRDHTGLSEETINVLNRIKTSTSQDNILNYYIMLNSMTIHRLVYTYWLYIREDTIYLTKQIDLLNGKKVNLSIYDFYERKKEKDLIMFELQEMNKNFLRWYCGTAIEELEKLEKESERIFAENEETYKNNPMEIVRFPKYNIE